jgi:hypothetical protein
MGMEFNVVKKYIKVVVGESSFEVVKPTVAQVEAYSKGDGSFDSLLEFMAQLGLPKDVARDFQFDSLQELLKMILPQEKKS